MQLPLLRALICGLSLLCCSLFARAQESKDDPIETDRPDQSQAATVIPHKTLQIETGVLFQRDEEGPVTEEIVSYPITTVRVGVLKWAELRVGLRFIDSTRTVGENKRTASGFGATSVGTKIQLLRQKGLRPDIAFLGMVTLKNGSREVRPREVAPQFRLCFANKLSEKLTLAYNLAYLWDGESDNGIAQYTASLQLELLEKLTLYAEVYGSRQDGNPFQQAGDAGLLFRLLNNLQLDVAAATKLNKYAPDYWLTGGVCYRIPK